jgi:hypothetical protein
MTFSSREAEATIGFSVDTSTNQFGGSWWARKAFCCGAMIAENQYGALISRHLETRSGDNSYT